MDQTSLSSVFVSSSVNKFYALNNRLVVNASVFLQQIPDTLLDSFRAELQKQVANAIQRRNNNIGLSHLYVDGPFSPIPAVQGTVSSIFYHVKPLERYFDLNWPKNDYAKTKTLHRPLKNFQIPSAF